MKHLIIIIITFLGTLTVVAQNCNCPTFKSTAKQEKNEIGINVFHLTKFGYERYFGVYKQNFINGIMYKHHDDKSAIRIGFDYYHSNFNIEEGVPITEGYSQNKGKYNMGELRLGYERKLTTTRLQPYIASDLIFTYAHIKGSSGSDGWAAFTLSPYDVTMKEIGIAPAMGLRYYLHSKFSIATEVNIELVYHQQSDIINPEGIRNKSGLRFYLNPLRLLSLNYHF